MTQPLVTFPRGAASEVRVTVNEYKGVTRVDCRVYYLRADGTLAPTQKGVAFKLDEVPDLIEALGRVGGVT